MTEHQITLTYEFQHRRELRPLHVLTRGSIEKRFIQLEPFELTVFVLVKRTHANIADTLTFEGVPFRRVTFDVAPCSLVSTGVVLSW